MDRLSSQNPPPGSGQHAGRDPFKGLPGVQQQARRGLPAVLGPEGAQMPGVTEAGAARYPVEGGALGQRLRKAEW